LPLGTRALHLLALAKLRELGCAGVVLLLSVFLGQLRVGGVPARRDEHPSTGAERLVLDLGDHGGERQHGRRKNAARNLRTTMS